MNSHKRGLGGQGAKAFGGRGLTSTHPITVISRFQREQPKGGGGGGWHQLIPITVISMFHGEQPKMSGGVGVLAPANPHHRYQ